jgi:glycosyltransferase involved in cell wall biosynthesis
MKILMLSPVWPLPANTGGAVRIFQIINGLGVYMDIDMVTPNGLLHSSNGKLSEELWELPKPNFLRSLFRNAQALISTQPYHVNLYHSARMQKKVNSLLAEEDYSLVFCHFISTIPYLRNCNLPIVLDQQNVDRQYWNAKVQQGRGLIKLVSYLNLLKTIHFENRWFRLVNNIISVSQLDSDAMQIYTSRWVRNFLVVPNGVDINKYNSLKHKSIANSQKNEIHLGFMGSFDVQVNCDAALRIHNEILPRVRESLPEFTVLLTLLGRNPPLKIRRLAKNNPNIFVPGTVSDVVPYLDDFDIFLAPLIGGAGTKLRLLEAMSMKLAIVASKDAIRGIDGLIEDGHIVFSNSPDEFSETIFMLAHNFDKRFLLGHAARKLAEEKYYWGNITKDLAEKLVDLYY